MNKLKFFIITALLVMSQSAFADTHTVSGDCSASAVQTAINAASGGDIIDVTCTGTVTWSSGVTISGGKTLKGGGAKTGNASTTTGSWPLVINITYSGGAAVTIVNAASQSLNRLTGFKFQGTGGPSNIINVYGVGVGSDSKGAFRIDNNYINGASYTNRVIVTDGSDGKMTGLLDHNIIYYISSNSPGYGNIAYQNNSHATSPTPCYGYDAWKRPTGFGTEDFVFYEDNYFMNSGIETSEGGGRLVVRYNYYNTNYEEYFSGLDGHGADTGGMYCIGIIANEFYKNDLPGSSMGHAVNMRGGKWMVHNNTLTNSILQIDEYRLTNPGMQQWKACDGDFCCPTTPAQCNVQAPQISDFASCYPVLNQVQGTYLWNNIKSGSNTSPTFVDDSALLQYYIVLNRDYWMPTYGTEANLPATCTAGANTFYGATDSGKLWNCDTTNHWTLTYTPYTYPHPLANDAAVDEYMVVIQKSGDGTGTVTEGDNINCGSSCSHNYYAYSGQEVTFTATPATGMYFSGWTGGCTGMGLTCTTTISGDATITASFTNGRKCSLGAGGGTITVGP